MGGRRVAETVMPNAEELARLRRVASQQRERYAVVRRAQMVLGLLEGLSPCEVAEQLGCGVSTVRKWRARWNRKPCVASLYDAPRSGRPPKFDLETRCTVVQLACDRPKDVPFREVWTQQTLADRLKACTGQVVSRRTIGRILRTRGLRPHRVRYWLHSPDPEFRAKVRRICKLYTERPERAVVLCVDEKPMQALERRFPTRVASDGSVRHEYEYIRHGTAALLSAFDISTGQVLARVVPKRSAEALVGFMEEVAAKYPQQRVYVVWDNLNTHYDGPSRRWTAFNARHGGRFTFVYTPLHASWVNQVEIWFSIVERRILRRASFESIEALVRRVEGFAEHWNTYEAHPFNWTFRGSFTTTPVAAAA